jgi:cell division septation protein DedD
MTSLLNLEHYTEPSAPVAGKAHELAPAPAAAPAVEKDVEKESVDYEIVVGRRQVAGAALVAIVLLAVFSGFSYLIGKSMGPEPVLAAAPAPAAPAPVLQIPVTPALPAPAPAPIAAALIANVAPRSSTAPIFADAIPGKVYLQAGIIDKGLAAIWVEGLRTHGLDAFVAAGPSDGLGLWRVLVGPLPDSQAFQRAKDTLDRLGVNTFGRRYQQ